MNRKVFSYLGITAAVAAGLFVVAIVYQQYTDGGYSDNGLWRGTFDINGRGPFNLTALYVNGKVVAVSKDARVLYRGVVALDGNKYRSSMDMFYMNANPFAKVNLKGHMPSADEIVARFKTVEVGDEGQLRMQMDKQTYYRTSSIEKIKGDWVLYRGYEITQLSIDENGSVQGGNTAACEYSGQAELIDQRYNAYQIKIALSSCNDRDGYFEGLGYLDGSVEADDTLHVYIFNEQWGSYMPIVRNDDSRSIDQRNQPTLKS